MQAGGHVAADQNNNNLDCYLGIILFVQFYILYSRSWSLCLQMRCRWSLFLSPSLSPSICLSVCPADTKLIEVIDVTDAETRRWLIKEKKKIHSFERSLHSGHW